MGIQNSLKLLIFIMGLFVISFLVTYVPLRFLISIKTKCEKKLKDIGKEKMERRRYLRRTFKDKTIIEGKYTILES